MYNGSNRSLFLAHVTVQVSEETFALSKTQRLHLLQRMIVGITWDCFHFLVEEEKSVKKVHMGGFHGLCLEVVHVTCTRIQWIKSSSRDQSWQQRHLGNAIFGSGDFVGVAASQGCSGEFLEKR